MLVIQYNLLTKINTGTEEAPVWEDAKGAAFSMTYSEANMAIAEAEAWGEITVEDDGKPEPEAPVSTDARVQALEAKLEAMEAAYTEGVEHA